MTKTHVFARCRFAFAPGGGGCSPTGNFPKKKVGPSPYFPPLEPPYCFGAQKRLVCLIDVIYSNVPPCVLRGNIVVFPWRMAPRILEIRVGGFVASARVSETRFVC